MDCRETQANFQRFIDYDLGPEETEQFISHIRGCDSCMKELELYYTMFTSLWQLENNEPLTADYQKELAEDIKDRYDDILFRKHVEVAAKAIAIAFLVLATLPGIIVWLLH